MSAEAALSRIMIRNMYGTHQNDRSTFPEHPAVAVAIEEHRGKTYARAELHWGAAYLAGVGVAYRHPSDCLLSKTGHELSAARALSDLSVQIAALGRAND
jgi:Domain of unknown function (DUF1876)